MNLLKIVRSMFSVKYRADAAVKNFSDIYGIYLSKTDECYDVDLYRIAKNDPFFLGFIHGSSVLAASTVNGSDSDTQVYIALRAYQLIFKENDIITMDFASSLAKDDNEMFLKGIDAANIIYRNYLARLIKREGKSALKEFIPFQEYLHSLALYNGNTDKNAKLHEVNPPD